MPRALCARLLTYTLGIALRLELAPSIVLAQRERRIRAGEPVVDSLGPPTAGTAFSVKRFRIDDGALRNHLIRVHLRAAFPAQLNVLTDNEGPGIWSPAGVPRPVSNDTSLTEVEARYPARKGATVIIDVLRRDAGAAATFELAVVDLGVPAQTWTVIRLRGDTVIRGTITPADFSTQGWFQDYYTLDSSDVSLFGRNLTIRLRSTDFDAHLVVFRVGKNEVLRTPGGQLRDSVLELQNDNEHAGTTDARVDVSVPRTPGSWVHIIASPHRPGMVGAYELDIQLAAPQLAEGRAGPQPAAGVLNRSQSTVLPQCPLSRTAGPTAPAWPQASIDIGAARDQLLRLLGERITKGEFETTVEFQARQAKFLREREERINALLRPLYPGRPSIALGSYDADSERYTVRLMEDGMSPYETYVHVPRDHARAFRDTIWARIEGQRPRQVSATFWLEEDGRTFMAGPATIRGGARSYSTGAPPVSIRFGRTIARRPRVGALSAVSPTIAVSLAGDSLILWDPRTETEIIRRLDTTNMSLRIPLAMPELNKPRLALSPDGSKLAILLSQSVSQYRSGEVRVWDTNSGRVLLHIQPGQTNSPRDIAFGCNGQVLAVAEYGRVSFWDVTRGAAVQELPVGSKQYCVGCRIFRVPNVRIALAPTGRFLAAASEDSTRLVDLTMGQEVWSINIGIIEDDLIFKRGGGLAFSPDGRFLAIAGGGRITVRDSTASFRRELAAFATDTRHDDYSFSPDSRIFATPGGLWDPLNGNVLRDEGASGFLVVAGAYLGVTGQGLREMRLMPRARQQ